MGVLDKFLDIMKLSDDDDYEDDDFFDDDYDDDYEDEKPKKGIFSRLMKSDDDYDDDDYIEERSSSKRSNSTAVSNKVTPMRPSNRRANNVSMEVCVIKPASVDDSREICETLLSGRTVILNLEGIDVELAQRIIDFASGACYSLNGSLQKISSYIFVLGPSSVDITGDLQNILGGATPSVRAGY